jgi:AAA15 family ATPase/GTPase
MLKKVHISNFLSCQDTEIELDGITALIGRNAAGKTNVLKAIEWCAQFAVGNASLYEHLSQFNAIKTECSFEFLIDNQIFKYEIKITTKTVGMLAAPPTQKKDSILIENLFCQKNEDWELVAKRNNDSAAHCNMGEKVDLEIKPQSPMIVSMLSLLPEKILNPSFNKIFNYLSEVKYYTLESYKDLNYDDRFDHIVRDVVYEEWLSKNDKSESSVVMRLLHLWHVDKDSLEELKALIGKNGLNLVDNITITTLNDGSVGDFYFVHFRIADNILNYSQLSYGTQRVLTLLLALLYDKNSTLLIEQPEDGIHSGLLKKLLPLCFEYATVYNKQIIIATHSPDVINLLPPESIRLVKMTENGTKVSPLNKGRMSFIHDYMENEGALFDFIESIDDE